jgi:hypothetical protein
MRQQWQNALLELLGKLIYRLAGIDHLEAIFVCHQFELFEQQRLVIDETLEEVTAQAHIHTRFPVIEPAALQHARDQVIQIDFQLKDRVRFE